MMDAPASQRGLVDVLLVGEVEDRLAKSMSSVSERSWVVVVSTLARRASAASSARRSAPTRGARLVERVEVALERLEVAVAQRVAVGGRAVREMVGDVAQRARSGLLSPRLAAAEERVGLVDVRVDLDRDARADRRGR